VVTKHTAALSLDYLPDMDALLAIACDDPPYQTPGERAVRARVRVALGVPRPAPYTDGPLTLDDIYSGREAERQAARATELAEMQAVQAAALDATRAVLARERRRRERLIRREAQA
jgi:hypothetical protein